MPSSATTPTLRASLPNYSNQQIPQQPTVFHLLTHLPAEIRLMIWDQIPRKRLLRLESLDGRVTSDFSPHHRIAHARRYVWKVYTHAGEPIIPTVLHICQETRHEYIRRYSPIRANPFLVPEPWAHLVSLGAETPFVDYETDIFALSRLSLGSRKAPVLDEGWWVGQNWVESMRDLFATTGLRNPPLDIERLTVPTGTQFYETVVSLYFNTGQAPTLEPFEEILGLRMFDVRRIRHAALYASHDNTTTLRIVNVKAALTRRIFPALKSISFLSRDGREPNTNTTSPPPREWDAGRRVVWIEDAKEALVVDGKKDIEQLGARIRQDDGPRLVFQNLICRSKPTIRNELHEWDGFWGRRPRHLPITIR
jgi:2EXR family